MKTNIKALALAIAASLTLSACGGSSSGSTTPEVPTNTAPSDIAVTNIAVDENSAGAVIGTLSATDANSADSFTFTTDSDMFAISGTERAVIRDAEKFLEIRTSTRSHRSAEASRGQVYCCCAAGPAVWQLT